MRKTKMLAALLAGLITLSLAGCGADKTENTGSDPASTESGITATVTDNDSEPTAESSLPTDSEIKQDESTAEKEKAESNAPPTAAVRQAPKSLPNQISRQRHRPSRRKLRNLPRKNRRRLYPQKSPKLLPKHLPPMRWQGKRQKR